MKSDIDLETFESTYNQHYSIELTDGSSYDLIPNGNFEKVAYEDRSKFIQMAIKARLTESDVQVAAVKRGLFKIIPYSLIKCKISFINTNISVDTQGIRKINLWKKNS